MPPIFATLKLKELSDQNATVTNASGNTLQVVCAWPVSGQYGPGSRVLYYVLVAACVFARKADWLRNPCLAAVLLFPAVAALHGITLAVLHVDDAVDMDIYGAFQLCSLGILAAPVTARLSRTYFDDPGRNMIFLWTILILAGMLSLTVEFFRTHSTGCPYDDSGNPISSNIGKFSYNVTCGLTCDTEQGPFSPMRRGAANNIYVIPAPDKLTFDTVTLFAAACCIPAVLSLVSMWNKILEINWKTRRAHTTEKSIDEQIEGTNGATIKRMNGINNWIRIFLSAVEAPLFGAAVIAILIMGERNFFSSQVRYQTEPIASIGQWAPIVGTGLAVLGSLYVAVAKLLDNTTEDADSSCSRDSIQGSDAISNVSSQSVISPNGYNHDHGGQTPTGLAHITTQSTVSHTADSGNRRKVAKLLTTVADYVGTAGHGQFDISGFRRGEASAFPEIPGEEHRNPKLDQIKERYNSGDRDMDGNLTPISSGRLSRTSSFQGSPVSGLRMSPPLLRTPSDGTAQPGAPSEGQTPVELQGTHSPSSASPNESKQRPRRDTLEVPPLVHLPSRTSPERPRISSITTVGSQFSPATQSHEPHSMHDI